MSQRDAQFTHVVSFRLTDEAALLAERLRAAFPDGTWAEMGRWFFDHPQIRRIIMQQIEEGEVEVEWTFEAA